MSRHPERLDERQRLLVVATLVAVTCALYGTERSITELLGHNQHPTPLPSWFSALPVTYFLQSPRIAIRLSMPEIMSLQGLAVLQSVVLLALYVALRPVRRLAAPLGIVLAAGTVTMLATALRATVMSSSDLYFYIGSALAHPSAYHPNGVPFPGEQSVINQIWGLPLFASGYGPLWIALSKVAVNAGHSLAAQLTALRCLGAVGLLACAGLIFLLTRSIALAAIVLLNPALHELYVVDGHNDLTAVAFVLAAAVLQSRLWIAIPLAAAAGLVKLPFALVAMLAFSKGEQLARRLIPALVAAGIAAIASVALVGPDYFAAMRQLYVAYERPGELLTNAAHVLLALLCFASVALVIARRTFLTGAPWTFLTLGQHAFPWYLAWGMPYAALADAPAVTFFFTLPVANVLLATDFPLSPVVVLLRWALVAAVIYAILVRWQKS